MKILAIESSSLVASAAIVEDDIMVAEYTMNYKKTHSQTLLPMIDEMCRMTEYDLENIDAIAVSAGPGSFTGLRIGSATAKGLGLALKKPLIHVPTVEAMAYNFFDTDKYIVPIMDARRRQVYTGIYTNHEGKVGIIMEQCLTTIDKLIEKINEQNQAVIFLGDGVPVFREEIEKELTVPVLFASAQMNRQKAGAVAELAKKYFAEGRIETAAEHAPDYLRPSQAERELKQKEH
jgi:tRNA threonylcarbamoyladenosine biosynthesis protein TsaB